MFSFTSWFPWVAPPWVQFVITAGAVVTALSVIHVKMIKPTKNGIQKFASDISQIRQLMENEPILTDIADAFRPNGGSSLPQTVKRIEGKIDKHLEWAAERDKELLEVRKKMGMA